MKVILLKDIARIGQRFDIKEVPSGHALNYLIPKKLAETATADSIKRVEAQKSKSAEDAALKDATFLTALRKLKESQVELKADANAKGILFKGIKADDIVDCLTKRDITLDPRTVILSGPIKELGEHTIELALGDTTGSFVLSVVAS
jgi:large subunit ribosomal protein L9